MKYFFKIELFAWLVFFINTCLVAQPYSNKSNSFSGNQFRKVSPQILSGNSFSNSILSAIKFNSLRHVDGLPSEEIHCVLQDRDDYLWVGTANGLARYNGYSFIVFKNEQANSSSLPDNNVKTLYEDNENNLWIGTDNGLCRYLPDSGNFEVYKNDSLKSNSLADNGILSIFQDKNNQFWIGTELALNKFDPKTGTCKRFTIQIPKEIITDIYTNYITSIDQVSDNELWLFSWNGLDLFDITKEIFTHFEPFPEFGKNDLRNYRYQTHYKRDNTFLIGTDIGFQIFDFSTRSFVKNQSITELNTQIVGTISGILEDQNRLVWISTDKGLYLLESKLETMCFFEINTLNPNSLSTNNISQIYTDKTGIIWISTFDGGLNYYDPNREKFKSCLPEINESKNKFNKSFKSTCIDHFGNLWIGTDYGLNKFDKNRRLLKTYIHNPKNQNSLPIGGTTAIYEDKKGMLWLGLWGGGLCRFNPERETFSTYNYKDFVRNDSRALGDISVLTIKEDKNGNLWLGMAQKMIDVFNPETNTFKHIYANQYMSKTLIIDDIQDVVWCGNQQGLLKIDQKTLKYVHYSYNPKNENSLINNSINGMVLDKLGFLWITTKEGLNKFNPESGQFSSFKQIDDLYSSNLLSIQQDKNGIFWISTESGILKFDPILEKCWKFDQGDGVKTNSAYSFQMPDGKLFFGGAEGVNVFYPDEIQINNRKPKIVFTDFKLFNKSVKPAKNKILDKDISLTKEIVLNYNQSSFSFEFAALNYTLSYKNQYSCFMEGFDKEWSFAGKERSATYTNLNPGDYTFRVKASNNDGVWNEDEAVIQLTILPPWWKTYFFRLFTVVFILSVFLLLMRIRTYKIKQNEKRLTKLVDEKTLEIQEQFRQKYLIEPEAIKTISIDEEFLKKAVAIIEKSIDNSDFDADILATELGQSRSGLYLKIKDVSGFTVNELIQNVRLKRAAQLLRTGQYTVSEISYMVGFTTIQYFNRRFKEIYGKTPTEFAKHSE